MTLRKARRLKAECKQQLGISNHMTLREALMAADLDKVYALINKRDQQWAAACDRPTLEQTVRHYGQVIKELLGKPRVKAYSMPILVETNVDPFDKKPYIGVCLLNPKYVKPPKGAKPWGGTRNSKMPKGKYNCNLDKYNRTFSMMGTRWSKIIDTEIRIEPKRPCTIENALANILWELTFDGWSEDAVVKKTAEIMGRLDEAAKEIKSGKCITLNPKKKGGFKVVIPDCVSKQMVDIANKVKNKTSPKKCGTCEGYGLWAMGDASPMGPMDGRGGMPTKACPECGANPNP